MTTVCFILPIILTPSYIGLNWTVKRVYCLYMQIWAIYSMRFLHLFPVITSYRCSFVGFLDDRLFFLNGMLLLLFKRSSPTRFLDFSKAWLLVILLLLRTKIEIVGNHHSLELLYLKKLAITSIERKITRYVFNI